MLAALREGVARGVRHALELRDIGHAAQPGELLHQVIARKVGTAHCDLSVAVYRACRGRRCGDTAARLERHEGVDGSRVAIRDVDLDRTPIKTQCQDHRAAAAVAAANTRTVSLVREWRRTRTNLQAARPPWQVVTERALSGSTKPVIASTWEVRSATSFGS